MAKKKARYCPVCREPIGAPGENRAFPFCSNHCRMVDLSRWFRGEYAVDPATGALDRIDPDEAEDVTEMLEH